MLSTCCFGHVDPDFLARIDVEPSLPHFCHTMNEKWPTDICKPLFAESEGFRHFVPTSLDTRRGALAS